MLARTPTTLVYLSAKELGITERERAGLIEVRDDLASGRVKHRTDQGMAEPEDGIGWIMNANSVAFNMENWASHTDCGTAHCIGGFMDARGVWGEHDRDSLIYSRRLNSVFWPGKSHGLMNDLSVSQAVRAIDHFLSGAGAECWPMALQDIPAA